METSVKIVPFLLTVQIDISRGTNSCGSNSNHSKDPGFEKMDELQLDNPGDDDLQFEDPTQETGIAEEVNELRDTSEDELTFVENDNCENKAMPCQVRKKVLEHSIHWI